MSAPQTPAVGRIVRYYQGDYEAPHGHAAPARWDGTNGTRWHPAIITRVWSETCVNLQVFFDAAPVETRTSVCLLPDEVFGEGIHCTGNGFTWPDRER